jgi:hypothetical protein
MAAVEDLEGLLVAFRHETEQLMVCHVAVGWQGSSVSRMEGRYQI